jgi:hypothetical protein
VRSLVDAVLVRRSDEQANAARFTGQHENDSWDVPKVAAPKVTKRARCLAGDCADRVKGLHGYCHKHWLKIVRGIPLDAIPGTRGRALKTRREGTGP